MDAPALLFLFTIDHLLFTIHDLLLSVSAPLLAQPHLFGVTLLVLVPEARDLDAVFDQVAADVEVLRDLPGSLPLGDELFERTERHERGRADGVGGLLVLVVVIARDGLAVLVLGDDVQAVGLVAQKDVADLFHQRRVVARRAVLRVEDDEPPAVRQRARRRPARPGVRALAQKVLARLL